MWRQMALMLALVVVSLFAMPAAADATDQRTTARHLPSLDLFILRVTIRSPKDVALLTGGGYDLLEARDGDALLLIGDTATLADLRARGLAAAIHAPLSALPARFTAQGYFGGYRTVAEYEARMDAIAAARPDLAQVVDYGDSWRKVNDRPNGHDLKAICITKRRPGDCQRDPNTDKPRLLMIAAIHPRELTTSEIAWRWMDLLVDGYGQDPDVTWLLDHHEMWVIPVANPDGRHFVEQGGSAPYLQRKNMNDSGGTCVWPPSHHYVFSQPGVDLNRNASFQWGVIGASTHPCSPDYRGLSAASEPEQAALEALMRDLFADQRGPALTDAAPITASGVMLTLHSFGDLILLPWAWTACGQAACSPTQRAPNDAGLRALAFRMGYYNGYAIGQASELLYPASGTTDDWAYGVLGVPSFTYEIGPSSGACGYFTPPYACQDAVFWPLNRPALLYAAKVARQPYALSLGPTTISVTLSSSLIAQGHSVMLTARIDDDALGNHPQSVGRPAAQPVAAAEAYLDAPPWAGGIPIALAAQDGIFDSATETVVGMLDTTALSVGRHLVFVRGRDAEGNWGPVTAQWLTVTDQVVYLPLVRR